MLSPSRATLHNNNNNNSSSIFSHCFSTLPTAKSVDLFRAPSMDQRDVSPVHLHLDSSDIPVNHSVRVQVKSPRNKNSNQRLSRSTKSTRNKSRSKSPSGRVWVPPPGRSSRNMSNKNDYCMEDGDINRSPVRNSSDTLCELQLTCDADPNARLRKLDYERKIDSLMGEVACLKNEMYLNHGAPNTAVEPPLDNSQGRFKDTEDILMTKLVEVEMEGQQTAKQVSALADTLQRLQQQERILVGGDQEMLSKQRKLVLSRLVAYERSNRCLRRLLRESHSERIASSKLREQREMLLANLSNTEHQMQLLQSQSADQQCKLQELQEALHLERDNLSTALARQSSLDSTKAHLQKQLKTKESDCNRMAVQIHALEGSLSQERIVHNRLSMEKTKVENDKDSLKKAARAYKMRACDNEGTVAALEARLNSKDALVEDLSRKVATYDGEVADSSKKQSSAVAENNALKIRVKELESILSRLEADSKSQVDELTNELQRRTKETTAARDQARDAKNIKNKEDICNLQIESEIEKKKALILQENKEYEIEKLETQTRELDGLRIKLKNSQDESRSIGCKLEDIDRKMIDLERQNRELINSMNSSDEVTQHYKQKFEDTSRENISLCRQLEASISDVKIIAENSREKSNNQTRATQGRIMDLESQLNQQRSELIKSKREKEEIERKTSNKVVDLKDRLEQAHSTNRSMQNYVQFLKNSYSNVFSSSVDPYSMPANTTSYASKTNY